VPPVILQANLIFGCIEQISSQFDLLLFPTNIIPATKVLLPTKMSMHLPLRGVCNAEFSDSNPKQIERYMFENQNYIIET